MSAAQLDRIKRLQGHLESSKPSQDLKDKVCIITGANSLTGIGRATALLFAHQGARHLYVLDYDGENLAELCKTVETRFTGCKADWVRGDASDAQVIQSLVQKAVDEEGRLDVFFANAGIAKALAIADTDPEDMMETLKINVLSCFLAIKYAIPAMLLDKKGEKEDRSGSIILTASVAGIRANAGALDYSASKAAVISMAQTAAWELATPSFGQDVARASGNAQGNEGDLATEKARTGSNIRVNAVCPGLIQTGMTGPLFDLAEARGTLHRVGQLIPLKRWGVAEEIAQVVAFLASERASYVNGQAWAVDGGLSASHPNQPPRPKKP